MRIYKLIAHPSSKNEVKGREVSWHSSEGAAKSARAKSVSAGTPGKDHELKPFDLQPGKAGLIDFLNRYKLM